MTEKMLFKARKRERRFRAFLITAFIFHGLSLGMFFFAVQPGSIRWFAGASIVFFIMGALFSGIAGIHANYFWGVAEGVIMSKEKREKLFEMCGELE